MVDVNNNPANPIINVRSYGEDPDLVIEFSSAFIRGMQDHGILTTAKHFPGHGDTETDSHTNLAQIPSDSTRLWSVELPPFVAAIDQGVDLVMATRQPDLYGNKLGHWIDTGSSPRASIALHRAGRASAWLDDRDVVTPDDVRGVLHAIMRHRLILTYDALADHVTPDDIIDELVQQVAVG